MFKGIHAEAKSEWLLQLCENKNNIIACSMPDRIRLLEKLAQNIKGIGDITIQETLLWYEENFPFK